MIRHTALRLTRRSMQRRYLSVSTARPAAKSSSGPKAARPLGAPQPFYTWKTDSEAPSSLPAALSNAKLRRAPFTDADAERLGALRDEALRVTQALPEAKQRLAVAGERVRGLRTGNGKEEAQALVAEERSVVRELEQREAAIKAEAMTLRLRLPNQTHPNVPHGREEMARVLRVGGPAALLPRQWQAKWGNAEALKKGELLLGSLAPDDKRDHVTLCAKAGELILAPAVSSADVAPSGFPHLSGVLAQLSYALEAHALRLATSHGAALRVVPDAVPTALLERSGFAPRAADAAQVYALSAGGEDARLVLAGTAELPLLGAHAGRVYTAAQLPIFEVAKGHAFRAEAGARGRESRGLYRVHQFTKAEMFVVCAPENSEDWLDRLVDIQVEMADSLALAWRVLDMPTEELGASAYRKCDMEVWMPGRGSWGEISSASNCTDFQARRVSIKHIVAHGTIHTHPPQVHAHTLNATAAAIPRLLVALVENHGFTSAGKLRLPQVLRRHWIGGEEKVVFFDPAQRYGVSKPSSPGAPSRASHGAFKPTPAAQSQQRPAAEAPKRSNLWQSSLARVRAAAAKSGTDPASMVLSFALLHEITAFVPLLALFWLLSAFGAGSSVLAWLLPPTVEGENEAQGGLVRRSGRFMRKSLDEGAHRLEKWGRRKGYFGLERGSKPDEEWSLVEEDGKDVGAQLAGGLANIIAAYAIVKLLLPVRIAASIALAGPFARLTIEPVKRLARRWKR